jgi:tetratricopeptide (TPR) repeat protein
LFLCAGLILQIGASKAAAVHYEEACSILSSNQATLGSSCYLQSLLLVTQGLIQFSQDKYDSACETFGTFLDNDWTRVYEENSSVVSHPYEEEKEETSKTGMKAKIYYLALLQAKDENLFSIAINNYAISCLYLKRNNEAVTRLEKLIGLNPLTYMTDPVVFNLCTMYDLSYSPDVSLSKKKALQKIANRFNINDPVLHWRSFRLN